MEIRKRSFLPSSLSLTKLADRDDATTEMFRISQKEGGSHYCRSQEGRKADRSATAVVIVVVVIDVIISRPQGASTYYVHTEVGGRWGGLVPIGHS